MKYIAALLLLVALTACSKEEQRRAAQEDPPTGELLFSGVIGGIDPFFEAQRFEFNVFNDSQFAATDISCQFLSEYFGVDGYYDPFNLDEGQDRTLTLYRFPSPEAPLINEYTYICYFQHKGQEWRREGVIQ